MNPLIILMITFLSIAFVVLTTTAIEGTPSTPIRSAGGLSEGGINRVVPYPNSAHLLNPNRPNYDNSFPHSLSAGVSSDDATIASNSLSTSTHSNTMVTHYDIDYVYPINDAYLIYKFTQRRFRNMLRHPEIYNSYYNHNDNRHLTYNANSTNMPEYMRYAFEEDTRRVHSSFNEYFPTTNHTRNPNNEYNAYNYYSTAPTPPPTRSNVGNPILSGVVDRYETSTGINNTTYDYENNAILLPDNLHASFDSVMPASRAEANISPATVFNPGRPLSNTFLTSNFISDINVNDDSDSIHDDSTHDSNAQDSSRDVNEIIPLNNCWKPKRKRCRRLYDDVHGSTNDGPYVGARFHLKPLQPSTDDDIDIIQINTNVMNILQSSTTTTTTTNNHQQKRNNNNSDNIDDNYRNHNNINHQYRNYNFDNDPYQDDLTHVYTQKQDPTGEKAVRQWMKRQQQAQLSQISQNFLMQTTFPYNLLNPRWAESYGSPNAMYDRTSTQNGAGTPPTRQRQGENRQSGNHQNNQYNARTSRHNSQTIQT